MVAVPDYSAGAMENWGLITFKEHILVANIFVHPGVPDVRRDVIAHELAHQWFGNMVTLKSWDELWLNEGFACYFENTKPYDKVGKVLRMDHSSLRKRFEEALERDAFSSTRPLSALISTPSEVQETFDEISYAKGSAIIFMTVKMIGEEHFRRALNHYIKKHFLQTAQGDDFWKALDETSTINYEGPDGGVLKMWHFGSQWTKQMGFPLVTVVSLNSTTVEVSQEKYMKNPYAPVLEKYRATSYGYKWDVPLFCQIGKDKVVFRWLRKEKPLYINVGLRERPIVINVERRGYFRQNYDPKSWKDIIEQLKEDHEIYTAATRYGIVSDAFAAAQIDRLEYEILFELLEYLPKEKVYQSEFQSGFSKQAP
ncbi:hypothetical protein Aduo_016550 [Ancylostoma duodenale]